MFMGAHTSARGNPTPECEWPEHAIELGQVLLTPHTGPSVGTARHRQTAAVTPYKSSLSIRLNVVCRI